MTDNITTTSRANHLIETLAVIPNVSKAKNITSSKGLFTGFLNLTIESAPIIPKDSAILSAIILDITYAIHGKSKKTPV